METIGKLNTNKGYVRNMLDKLAEICSDLVRLNGDWQQWDFPKSIDVLRQCRERNLLTEAGKNRPEIQKDKNFKTHEQNATNRKCTVCDETVHKLN